MTRREKRHRNDATEENQYVFVVCVHGYLCDRMPQNVKPYSAIISYSAIICCRDSFANPLLRVSRGLLVRCKPDFYLGHRLTCYGYSLALILRPH
jgi:hypothetical protein